MEMKEDSPLKKGNGSFRKTKRKKPNNPKEPKKPREPQYLQENRTIDQEYIRLLSLLATLPFHHLLSAQQIYSSIIAGAADAANIKIPTVFESPSKRLQMFQRAAAEQSIPGAEAVPLDRFLQLKFSDTDLEGRESKIIWLVVFQDELQGCAELYRAEMLLFKRLLYEQKEYLPTPLIITNEEFGNFIDYELFDRLTNNNTDGLFIESLSADCQVSATPFDDNDESAGEDEEIGGAVLTDRIHNSRSYNADPDEFRKTKNEEFPTNGSPTGNENEDKNTEAGNSERLDEKPAEHTRKDKKNTIRVYELNIGNYWRKWRQAAHLTGFDFDLLEKIGEPQVIRFYELSKMLRLSSYDKTTRTLPTELEIEYERFAMLMPLPKFHTEEEIKTQMQELIRPLISAGYVENFSYAEESNNREKSVSRIYFKFRD